MDGREGGMGRPAASSSASSEKRASPGISTNARPGGENRYRKADVDYSRAMVAIATSPTGHPPQCNTAAGSEEHEA